MTNSAECWTIMLPNPPEGPEIPAGGFGCFPDIMAAHTACATAVREGKLPRGCWIKGTHRPVAEFRQAPKGETPFGESPSDGTETGKDR